MIFIDIYGKIYKIFAVLGVSNMAATITSIREQVALYKGLKVRYRTAKGRRKVEERQGIILETYPNLFTLYVESQDSKVSFSYAELLTREVELELLSGNRN
ncbi:MAG: Veg family protein [Aminobacteriaceae bacterium]